MQTMPIPCHPQSPPYTAF
ncbi:UNVERIFIED_CONTAM: hypothetical protein GTU68_014045 [Idotea baltica]|nr:hypothetical protein [Idotea baltica]